MTPTLLGNDVRGFYAAIGVQLPRSEGDNVSVRCFVSPDQHRRGDRNPSCSVNLVHGAWKCHGCGAEGGAFDAADQLGIDRRTAMDLLRRYGISKRDPAKTTPPPKASRGTPKANRGPESPSARSFAATEADVTRWRAALDDQPGLVERLRRERSWRYRTMRELELGFDRGRITIPVRDHRRRLIGLLRYQPWPAGGHSKMRAAVGSRRQLLPHPAAEPSQRILLVEGEPDMIAARSRRLPAIAVPGVESWRPEWAADLAGRQITIVMDADEQGRAAARRIAGDLKQHSQTTIIDLAPDRLDGYDVTDWLMAGPQSKLGELR